MTVQQAPELVPRDDGQKAGGDDSTRHLSAAVHVDEQFADELINEYLSERRRAIPPSPGVEPVTVLREALSGRSRRAVRDLLLLVLLGVGMVCTWQVVYTWLVVGVLGGAIYSARQRSKSEDGRRRVPVKLIVAFIVVGLVLVLLYASFNSQSSYGSHPYYGGDPSYNYTPYGGYPTYGNTASGTSWDVVKTIVGVLAQIAMLAVLVVDRLRVKSLLRNRFSPQNYPTQYPALSNSPRNAWYAQRLALIGRSSEYANTRVHDGYWPFVGSGHLVHAWSIAVPLKPTDGAGDSSELVPAAVYEAVRAEVLAMRDSEALSPGARLRGLKDAREAITSATALLQHRNDTFGRAMLPDPAQPPVSAIDPLVIEDMTRQAPEWVRPYQCFRVATWCEEMVVSGYLHVGCSDDMLYLEWNAFQLMPISSEYRYERMAMRSTAHAVTRGVLDYVAFPATLARRVKLLWRVARDNALAGKMPSASVTYDAPARYGARRSLREIAAADEATTYLQEVDKVRYVKLLEQRVVSAVSHCLRDHGLATEEFSGHAQTVLHSTVVNGGTFNGATTIGQGNTVNVAKPTAEVERLAGKR